MIKPFKMKRSVAGSSHKYKNCQDACRIEEWDNGIYVAAVADGHGSPKCKYSNRGAEIAAKTFCSVVKDLWISESVNGNQEIFIRLLRQKDSVDLVQEIHKTWKERIEESGKSMGLFEGEGETTVDPELYGTTLLGMVIAEHYIFAIQIGDGDIMLVNSEGAKHVIDPPKFLGTETYSLSNKRPWENAVAVFQRFDVPQQTPYMFMMTTDGFANSFRDDEQFKIACQDYLKTIVEYGPDLVKRQLQKWLVKTSTNGCGDDITFLAIGAIEK